MVDDVSRVLAHTTLTSTKSAHRPVFPRLRTLRNWTTFKPISPRATLTSTSSRLFLLTWLRVQPLDRRLRISNRLQSVHSFTRTHCSERRNRQTQQRHHVWPRVRQQPPRVNRAVPRVRPVTALPRGARPSGCPKTTTRPRRLIRGGGPR